MFIFACAKKSSKTAPFAKSFFAQVMGKIKQKEFTSDGKLDLSIREKAYLQMDQDAQTVLKVIDEFDGVLPFNDKASPEVIERELKLSKNAFKRAVGRLLKEGKIEITERSIRRKS